MGQTKLYVAETLTAGLCVRSLLYCLQCVLPIQTKVTALFILFCKCNNWMSILSILWL